MNVRQYLQLITDQGGMYFKDSQVFGSVDRHTLKQLEPNQTVFVVTEGRVTITAKSYVVESINRRLAHGPCDYVLGLIACKGDERINVDALDYNVDPTHPQYGSNASRIFTDVRAAQLYLESFAYVNECRLDSADALEAKLEALIKAKRGAK